MKNLKIKDFLVPMLRVGMQAVALRADIFRMPVVMHSLRIIFSALIS
ncbi:MAG: hypothetical protein GY749_30785 [Desulfobacteraceae bacterium]|nr:hypothetical protein [Desulfobacteraceae bacterium]